MTSHDLKSDLAIIQEHDATDDAIRKQYENMSYDEMSQRLQESYKQLSEMIGSRESSTATTNDDSDTDDNDDNDDQWLELEDEAKKKTKLAKVFWRACSSGDSEKVQKLLNDPFRPFIDVNNKDDDGTTPLIYASCFGKVDIVHHLLVAGAKTDIQDAFGWSALMWATNNNHEQVVKHLLDHGASAQTKSSKGRTVFDFVNTDNQKMIDILATNPRDSFSSTSSAFRNGGSLSSSSSTAGDLDFYYQSTVEGYDSFMSEEADRRKRLLESVMKLDMHDLDHDHPEHAQHDDHGGEHGHENDENDDDDALDDPSLLSSEFQWDKCLPDQMFVFNEKDLPYILDTVITHIQLPMRSQLEICIPANVVFLSARFAHYFSSQDLLDNVLDGAMQRMTATIKGNTRNIHVLAFWMTNATQLLHYLKKDGGLVVATAMHQLGLSELISEIYTILINDLERRMNKVLGPALLEHDEIPGMDQVNFADDWQRFFRRSNSHRRSVILDTTTTNGNSTTNGVSSQQPPHHQNGIAMKRNVSNPLTNGATTHVNGNGSTSSPTSSQALLLEHTARLKARPQNMAISPQSITSLLSSTLFVLQSYDVHPTIIIQVLAQFFHYLSCELFNRILTNKKMLCRSKALQIRMNLSHIEDWIRANQLPASLASYLTPTTQLLQLLQCLTQLTDLVSFINTVKAFDVLNALQVKRCVVNYRYEVNETRVPEEVEKYAMQLAEDTIRHHQARTTTTSNSATTQNAAKKDTAAAMARSHSQPAPDKRRESMVLTFMSSMLSSSSSTSPPTPTQAEKEANDNENDENRDDKETTAAATTAVDMAPQPSVDSSTTSKKSVDLPDREDDDKAIMETRDSKFMLPFSVPTNASAVTPLRSKNEHIVKERLLVPVIPEDWMDKLDKGQA
ncbi:hypothetical protein BC940DRAFT_316235 [Gongronella butleri]|nr:hypothetical protein BC940DRAFT_316235 [Gongronella butleri]